MNSNIFIPKQIKVGFQNRSDTYTKKLAYIIYYDEKEKLRKENSWNSWRDYKIDPKDFQNEPTEGFVLNKKAGGYSTGWNHRQTYCRVYDPRGFEFEISIENLLYILENTNSIKGKGLEGEFIYGWSGKDLLLIPTSSPDYKEIKAFNEKVHKNEYIKGKDLIIGATYRFKDNSEQIYMGRFQKCNGEDKEYNEYFFARECWFNHYKSISKQIIEVVDEQCVENYANKMDELEKSDYISERDQKQDKYEPYELNDFRKKFEKYSWKRFFYDSNGEKYFIGNHYSWHNTRYNIYSCYRNRKDERLDTDIGILTIYDKYKPHYLVTHKKNGEIIKKWKD